MLYMYGSGKKKTRLVKRLEAIEILISRKMKNISRAEHTCKYMYYKLRSADSDWSRKSHDAYNKKRQMKWMAHIHVLRSGSLLRTVIEGKTERNKDQDRLYWTG